MRKREEGEERRGGGGKKTRLIMFYAFHVEMTSLTFWRAASSAKSLPTHYFSIGRPAAESFKLSNSDNVMPGERERDGL